MTSINVNMTVHLDATKYHILAAYAQASGQICLPYKSVNKDAYYIHVVFEDAQTSAIVNTQVNVTYYYVEI